MTFQLSLKEFFKIGINLPIKTQTIITNEESFQIYEISKINMEANKYFKTRLQKSIQCKFIDSI